MPETVATFKADINEHVNTHEKAVKEMQGEFKKAAEKLRKQAERFRKEITEGDFIEEVENYKDEFAELKEDYKEEIGNYKNGFIEGKEDFKEEIGNYKDDFKGKVNKQKKINKKGVEAIYGAEKPREKPKKEEEAEEEVEVDYEEIAEGTVEGVQGEVESREEIDLEKLLEAEESNKDRTTLEEWLEERI